MLGMIKGEACSTGIWQGLRELWLIGLRYRANYDYCHYSELVWP